MLLERGRSLSIIWTVLPHASMELYKKLVEYNENRGPNCTHGLDVIKGRVSTFILQT